MQQIHVSDQLYREVFRRATEAGFESVDAYIADMLQHELDDAENLDWLFTPERLAHIDQAAAEIAAGKGLTPKQVDAELVKAQR